MGGSKHYFLKGIFYVKVLWILLFMIHIIYFLYYNKASNYNVDYILELAHDIFTFLLGLFILTQFNILTDNKQVCLDGHGKIYLFGAGVLIMISLLKKTLIPILITNNKNTIYSDILKNL